MGHDSVFVARTRLPAPVAEAFAWHERPGAFERLAPPWATTEVVARSGGIKDGAQVAVRLKLGPVPLLWSLRHKAYEAGRQFCDEQVDGPFKSWRHEHIFSADANGTRLEDRVTYRLPLGGLGRLAGGGAIEHRLEQLFAYRASVLGADLAAHQRFASSAGRRVVLTGASGLLGRQLCAFFASGGWDVVRLVRPQTRVDEAAVGRTARWDPSTGEVEPGVLDGADAVVHLSGENVGDGRWTDERKRRLRESRVATTRAIAGAIARAARPPGVLISASAIGYYAPGAAEQHETAPAGAGFLADLSREWEEAAAEARERGVRVVHPRIGIVLTPEGGALAKLLPVFRAGLGGRVGEGGQWMSWITIDDVVGAIHHAVCDERVAGPVNLVAPEPVTNERFVDTLGTVLGRPTALPVPSAAIELAFGEMGRTLLLDGIRVVPRRLAEAGYRFRHPVLGGALEHLLGRRRLPEPKRGPAGETMIEV